MVLTSATLLFRDALVILVENLTTEASACRIARKNHGSINAAHAITSFVFAHSTSEPAWLTLVVGVSEATVLAFNMQGWQAIIAGKHAAGADT